MTQLSNTYNKCKELENIGNPFPLGIINLMIKTFKEHKKGSLIEEEKRK